MIKNIIFIAQMVVSILLIVSVLLQQRGSGLGGAFGGSGEFYHRRRGAEKLIFGATVVFAVLFFGLSLASFLIK